MRDFFLREFVDEIEEEEEKRLSRQGRGATIGGIAREFQWAGITCARNLAFRHQELSAHLGAPSARPA